MRRKDRETSRETALSIAQKADYGILSLCMPDGTPYGVPISPVYLPPFFYFHCAQEGEMLQALKYQPQVCLSFVSKAFPIQERLTMGYASCLVFGTAAVVQDEQEKESALLAICRRYAPDVPALYEKELHTSLKKTAIIRIEAQRISGKQNLPQP